MIAAEGDRNTAVRHGVAHIVAHALKREFGVAVTNGHITEIGAREMVEKVKIVLGQVAAVPLRGCANCLGRVFDAGKAAVGANALPRCAHDHKVVSLEVIGGFRDRQPEKGRHPRKDLGMRVGRDITYGFVLHENSS